MRFQSRVGARVMVLSVAAALSGCAATSNPKDPFEGFNRAVFKFNDTVDQAAIKPAATVYKNVLPSFVQTGIGNFFGNIGDVWTAINNLLQGNGAEGLSDVMRVALNTTLGIGGLIDFGSEAGMTKHKEDFGQTLGVWGVKAGPYVVLPIYGSYTLRDTAAFPLDFVTDPWVYVTPVYVRNIGTAVRLVDRRAVVLDASDLIEEAALDKYEFVRDAYLQRRESQIGKSEAPYSLNQEDSIKDGEQQRSLSAMPPPVQASDAGVPAMKPAAAAAPNAEVPPSDLVVSSATVQK